jgi:multiple sugar transport system substrate-binding protein
MNSTEPTWRTQSSVLTRRNLLVGLAGSAALAGNSSAFAGEYNRAPMVATRSSSYGPITFGSFHSADNQRLAMAMAVKATGLDTQINTVDHYGYQDNFNTYVQQPDDVFCWFGGYRMRGLAAAGLLGDVSDVWTGITDMSPGYKRASTGFDGKQYFVRSRSTHGQCFIGEVSSVK